MGFKLLNTSYASANTVSSRDDICTLRLYCHGSVEEELGGGFSQLCTWRHAHFRLSESILLPLDIQGTKKSLPRAV